MIFLYCISLSKCLGAYVWSEGQNGGGGGARMCKSLVRGRSRIFRGVGGGPIFLRMQKMQDGHISMGINPEKYGI